MPKNEAYPSLDYPFLQPIPFSEGLTWIWVHPTTNTFRLWVLDVRRGEILGELSNIEPLFIDGVGKKCFGKTVKYPANAFMARFNQLVTTLTKGRFNFRVSDDTYWILDLNSGNADFIGKVPDMGTLSTAASSPNSKRAYLLYAKSKRDSENYLMVDLAERSIKIQTLPGEARGWWSNTEMLYKTASNDFELYDVEKQKSASPVSFKMGCRRGVTKENILHGSSTEGQRSRLGF